MPLTDIGWGLAAFALGWLAINFAEAYEHLAVDIRCACGRREMRDVLCAPQDRVALARELSKACFHCNAQSEPAPCPSPRRLRTPPLMAGGVPPGVNTGAQGSSAPRVYPGDHDGE